MVRPPDPRLVGFLSAYERRISDLALALRKILLEEAPESIESIYDAYNAVAIGFSFTGRLKDSFCHIAAYSNHVNLGFNRGASLADSQGILVGAGKSVRHIRIESESDLKHPSLRDYVRAAIRQVAGPGKAAPGGAKSIVKGNYRKKRRPNLNRKQ
jgi:hypothetical protein